MKRIIFLVLPFCLLNASESTEGRKVAAASSSTADSSNTNRSSEPYHDDGRKKMTFEDYLRWEQIVLTARAQKRAQKHAEAVAKAEHNPLTILEAIEKVKKIRRSEDGYAVSFGSKQILAPTEEQMQEFSRRFPRVTKIWFKYYRQQINVDSYPDDEQNPNHGIWHVEHGSGSFNFSLFMPVEDLFVGPQLYVMTVRRETEIAQRFWKKYEKWLNDRADFYRKKYE